MSDDLGDDLDGLCPVCGRETMEGQVCACCKKCGSVLTPCACEFDLSTATGQRDFEKYGEMFIPIVPIRFEPAPGERPPMEMRYSRLLQQVPHALRGLDYLVDAGRCEAATQIEMPIDKALATHRCALREGHDGEHRGQDGTTWSNSPCLFRAVIKHEVYNPVQCDKPAGHVGPHEAYRGDGITENYHWTWGDDSALAPWVPLAYAVPRKKRSLLSIVREFFRGRRHIRPPEGGPKTGGGS